jgi:hypothetical protein
MRVLERVGVVSCTIESALTRPRGHRPVIVEQRVAIATQPGMAVFVWN